MSVDWGDYDQRLRAVRWDKLEHAYGSAKDVPALLVALRSPDPELRETAWSELHGNLWHQGTIYEATFYAVPYFIELLNDTDLPQLEEVLNYLATLMDGASYIDAHRSLNLETHTSKREAAMQMELLWVARTKAAIGDGYKIYLEFLSDPVAKRRVAAVNLVSQFGEDYPDSFGEMRRLVTRAGTNQVTELALAYVARRFPSTSLPANNWLTEICENSTSEHLRVLAATSHAIGHGSLHGIVASVLLEQLLGTEALDSALSELGEYFFIPDAEHVIVDAICVEPNGSRAAVAKFNELLEEQGDNERLRDLHYNLSCALTEESVFAYRHSEFGPIQLGNGQSGILPN